MDQKADTSDLISRAEFENQMDLVGQALQELTLLVANQHLREGADHIENINRLISAIRFGRSI